MEILFWIILGPIIFWLLMRVYNTVVADFAPDKKRRKKAVEDNKVLQNVSDRYVAWWERFIWGSIKFVSKWSTPVGFILFILYLLMGGEI